MTALHVTVDAGQASLAEVIETAARSGPLLILTERMLRMLTVELGSHDAAMRHLLAVSTKANRPIGANFPTANGSRTAFVAPSTWTQERLRGWVAGRHEEISEMFGPATPGPLEDV